MSGFGIDSNNFLKSVLSTGWVVQSHLVFIMFVLGEISLYLFAY